MRFTELVSVTRDNFRSFLGGTRMAIVIGKVIYWFWGVNKSFRVQKIS